MKKIEKFSKSSKDIISIKKDFFNENNKLYQNSIKINKFFTKQKKRKKCKNCGNNIFSYDFISHGVKYKICSRCNHINGMYEESSNFLNYLYRDDPNSNYSKTYLKNYEERVNKIYLPKAKFLKKVINKKKITILEIGSGGGHFLKACEKIRVTGLGFESNNKLVSLANKKLIKNKVSLVNLNNSINKIKDSKSDCLVLISVLEHVQNPNQLIKAFKESKIKFLYIVVPLFSLSVYFENIFKGVYPRLLGGAHTHIYSKQSLEYLVKKFKFKIVGEWWFGNEFVDLFRSISVKSKFLVKNKIFFKNFKKIFVENIDNFQKILDKKKLSSQVHIVLSKKTK